MPARQLTYTKYEVAELIFTTWRETVLEGVGGEHLSPQNELAYLKENIQEEYDLTNADIKKIFDEINHPFYWDIEEDKVKNSEYDPESEDD